MTLSCLCEIPSKSYVDWALVTSANIQISSNDCASMLALCIRYLGQGCSYNENGEDKGFEIACHGRIIKQLPPN